MAVYIVKTDKDIEENIVRHDVEILQETKKQVVSRPEVQSILISMIDMSNPEGVDINA